MKKNKPFAAYNVDRTITNEQFVGRQTKFPVFMFMLIDYLVVYYNIPEFTPIGLTI